jgi:HK97 family phage prohead protease
MEHKKTDSKIEKRSGGEIRAENEIAEGYAVIFNSFSRNFGNFREIISPDALEGVIARSDVFALIDHNRYKGVLARSKFGTGSLTLKVDDKGLFYCFSIADTQVGNELRAYLKRGEIDSSSFSFTVKSDTWEKNGDGSYTRTINKIDRLYDVSPVFSPAYEDTSAALRRMDEYIKYCEDLEKGREKLEAAMPSIEKYYSYRRRRWF